MRLFTLLVLAILFPISARPQPVDSLLLLPEGLHFAPLRADIQEPRIGVFKFSETSDMKVDIGNSIDVFGLAFPGHGVRLTVGIDFMAYARTVGAEGLRLQIDAIDGFFGGNLSASKTAGGNILEARLRILHHSAHLVDGHYINGSWAGGKIPVPFTRDFGELVTGGILRHRYGQFRPYAGFAYATLVRPADIERVSYVGGCEAAFDRIIDGWNGSPVNFFLAWNMTMTGTPVYASTHQVQAGIKLGEFFGKGPSLYVAWYNGRNMFAEYFDERVSTFGAGFTVDFF
jgi:hypothetical protein